MTGAEVSIERVRLELRSPHDRASLGQGADALGELVRWVDELSVGGPALEQFCRAVLADVLGKVPPDVLASLAHDAADSQGDIPQLDDAAGLLALLGDVARERFETMYGLGSQRLRQGGSS